MSALQHQFYLIASRIEEENAKAKKLEAKIDILTFGYRKREQKLCDDVFDLDLDLEEAESNHDVYVMLAAQETNAVQMRLQVLHLLFSFSFVLWCKNVSQHCLLVIW